MFVDAQCKRFIVQQFTAPPTPPLEFDVTVQLRPGQPWKIGS